MELHEFEDDIKTVRAVEREFEIIGEAVKCLPDEILTPYPQIPWKSIAGMRDHLIHHYWDTEVEILWTTIQESLPSLKEAISELLDLHSGT